MLAIYGCNEICGYIEGREQEGGYRIQWKQSNQIIQQVSAISLDGWVKKFLKGKWDVVADLTYLLFCYDQSTENILK